MLMQAALVSSRTFIIPSHNKKNVRRNYKCTRGHKRNVYKYSLHVSNQEIDQEKQNNTVAR